MDRTYKKAILECEVCGTKQVRQYLTNWIYVVARGTKLWCDTCRKVRKCKFVDIYKGK